MPLSEIWAGTVNGSVGVTYDNNFRVTSRTVGATPITYTYDADGLLTGSGALTLSRNVQNGLLTGTTLAGTTTSNSYNDCGSTGSNQAKSLKYNELRLIFGGNKVADSKYKCNSD